MRLTVALAMAAGFAASPDLRQDPQPPRELTSPNAGKGTATDYLNGATEAWLKLPEGRHAALLMLQELPDTREYLGKPLAAALRPEIQQLLAQDLKSVAWADIHCVPGEATVIAFGLRHARRFKQISLPALWEISQAKPNEGSGMEQTIQERMKKHALRVLWDIYKGSKDPQEFKRRLADLGEKALVAQLDEWEKK